MLVNTYQSHWYWSANGLYKCIFIFIDLLNNYVNIRNCKVKIHRLYKAVTNIPVLKTKLAECCSLREKYFYIILLESNIQISALRPAIRLEPY